jgi:tetratricopeptide (TPR) repeat protein
MTAAPARALTRFDGADVRSRSRSWDDARAALLGAVVLMPLAAVNGGYWPTAWNWSALAFLWIAAVGLVLLAPSIGRLEIAIVGALLAVLAWTGASALWSADVGQTVLETQRGLVFLGALAAVLVVVRGSSYRALLLGIWAAIALTCGYALLTRLLPERLGIYDPIAGYRLAQPLGYWNALGIFAVIGSLLALGFVAHAGSVLVRAAAAASLLLTIPTLYFTFSRGAWIALAAGLGAAFALDTRRLALASALLVVSPFAAFAVWRASESRGLTRLDSPLALASHDGHRLVVLLVLLAAAAAVAVSVVFTIARRVSFSAGARRAYAIVLIAAVVAAATAVFAHYGTPSTLARKGYDSFTSSSPAAANNLNERLFTLASPRREIWSTAWDDVEAHPLLGSGAGAFERFWLKNRTNGGKVRDAHSLYLETLAELGPLGLVLLLVMLALPVAAALRARRRSLVAPAFAAYIAFLVHAGVDWDWEMPAVTVAGLLCGAAILLAARSASKPFRLTMNRRAIGVGIAMLLAAYAFVGLLGNRALSAANAAAEARRPAEEESQARKALRWAPWSSEPRRLLAEGEYSQGHLAAARTNLRKALAQDPGNWQLWFNLANASRGRERTDALRRAHRLNPLSPELSDYEASLRSRSP